MSERCAVIRIMWVARQAHVRILWVARQAPVRILWVTSPLYFDRCISISIPKE